MILMRSSKLYAVFGLTALTVLGLGAVDSVLKLTGKLGDIRQYKLTFDGTTTDGTVKITGDLSRKVIKVDPDGLVTLQESHTNLSFVFNGNQMAGLPSILDKVLKPDGTTAELRGEGATPEGYRAAVLSTVMLPDFPLATDKTWSWDVPADPKHGSVKARADYKVLGEERLHDIDTWKIYFTVTEIGDSSVASSTSTVWISKSDASLVKSVSLVKNLPLKSGPLSGTQTVDLAP